MQDIIEARGKRRAEGKRIMPDVRVGTSRLGRRDFHLCRELSVGSTVDTSFKSRHCCRAGPAGPAAPRTKIRMVFLF